MKPFKSLFLSITAILLALVGQCVEGASWTSPVQLGGENTSDPVIAVDPQGNAVSLWVNFPGGHYVIQAATLSAGGNWSAPVTLSDPNLDGIFPAVAMDDQGNAVAVWSSSDSTTMTLQSATWLNNGSNIWVTSSLASPILSDVTDLKVAFDKQGNALAVWGAYDYEKDRGMLQAARLPFGPNSSWVSVEEYVLGDKEWIFNIDFALDPSGNAMAVWATNAWLMKATTLSYSSLVWSEPVILSSSDDISIVPNVAVDKNGNAVAVWLNPNKHMGVSTSSYNASTKEWTKTNLPSIRSASVSLAMSSVGNATLVWQSILNKDDPDSIQCSTLPLFSKEWSAPLKFSTTSEESMWPIVKLDASGKGIVVWTNKTSGVLQASVMPEFQVWSPPFSLAFLGDVDTNFPNGRPAVGLSSSAGSAVIVFPSLDQSFPRVIQSVVGKDIFIK